MNLCHQSTPMTRLGREGRGSFQVTVALTSYVLLPYRSTDIYISQICLFQRLLITSFSVWDRIGKEIQNCAIYISLPTYPPHFMSGPSQEIEKSEVFFTLIPVEKSTFRASIHFVSTKWGFSYILKLFSSNQTACD